MSQQRVSFRDARAPLAPLLLTGGASIPTSLHTLSTCFSLTPYFLLLSTCWGKKNLLRVALTSLTRETVKS